MNEKEFHKLLVRKSIRLFDLRIGRDRLTLIHHNKSVEDWREDVRRFIAEIKHLRNKAGWANDGVFNQLIEKLQEAGYFDVSDIVSDVYEGRVAVYSAGIEDDPAHEDQTDGFGHYGLEAKNKT